MSVRPPCQCLNCGCYMTLKDWYPEMLCEDCVQDINSALTDENRQEGLEYPDECY